MFKFIYASARWDNTNLSTTYVPPEYYVITKYGLMLNLELALSKIKLEFTHVKRVENKTINSLYVFKINL